MVNQFNEMFKYIGSLKSAHSNCNNGIRSRIGMANQRMLDLVPLKTNEPGAKVIKKFGAWIGAQLKILCSKFRKLRSGDCNDITLNVSLGTTHLM